MVLQCDVAVIGAGTGGEQSALKLRRAGRSVILVERELIGGECAYWACIPSKVLLHVAHIAHAARKAAGLQGPRVNWNGVAQYRDAAVQHLDDAAQLREFAREGVMLLRGEARIVGPGRLKVDDREVAAQHIIVATGSDARIPDITGLREAGYWTSRDATLLTEIPASVVVLGGSAVAVELGQMLRRFGAAVTLVERSERLLKREDEEVGAALKRRLANDDITLYLNRTATRVTRGADGMRTVTLDDGTRLRAERILVAVGRIPRTAGMGLEKVGVLVSARGIEVDECCRAAEGVWAVGDVTGQALYTHVAHYQAQVAAENILGRRRVADYQAVPRVVFTDPEVGAVGLTAAQAHDQGIEVAASQVDLTTTIAAPATWGGDVSGMLGLVADRRRRVLVGAWGVGPGVGEWIHIATLAIRAAVPIEVLRDLIIQFPTFSEGYLYALERLEI
jgi:dihydrolipoamide dehydrogenase